MIEELKMVGPQAKKMLDKSICTGCHCLFSKEFGGSIRIPKKQTVNYCKHPNLEDGIAFINKGVPYTPEWCPEHQKRSG